jgi:hypothetical protein
VADMTRPALELAKTHRLFGAGTWMKSLVFVGRSKVIVSCWNAGVVLFDLDRGEIAATVPRKLPGYTGALALSADRKQVLFVTHDDQGAKLLEVRDVKSFDLLAELSLPAEASRVVVSRDNKVAVVGQGDGGWIGLYDLVIGR